MAKVKKTKGRGVQLRCCSRKRMQLRSLWGCRGHNKSNLVNPKSTKILNPKWLEVHKISHLILAVLFIKETFIQLLEGSISSVGSNIKDIICHSKIDSFMSIYSILQVNRLLDSIRSKERKYYKKDLIFKFSLNVFGKLNV